MVRLYTQSWMLAPEMRASTSCTAASVEALSRSSGVPSVTAYCMTSGGIVHESATCAPAKGAASSTRPASRSTRIAGGRDGPLLKGCGGRADPGQAGRPEGARVAVGGEPADGGTVGTGHRERHVIAVLAGGTGDAVRKLQHRREAAAGQPTARHV